MFTPILDLEVITKATVLRFTDVTGPDIGAGTKWDGIGGIVSFNVSAATLTVTDPNSSVSTLDVRPPIIASWPVSDDIVLGDISGEWVDGWYQVQYDVWMVQVPFTTVSDYALTVPGTVLITANGHAITTGMKVTIVGVAGIYDGFHDATRVDDNHFYISATWSVTDAGTITPCYSNTFHPFVFSNVEMAIERMLATFANMDESVEGDDYLKQVIFLNGLLWALRSAITTTTVARINNIYGRITRILDFHNIELTYS